MTCLIRILLVGLVCWCVCLVGGGVGGVCGVDVSVDVASESVPGSVCVSCDGVVSLSCSLSSLCGDWSSSVCVPGVFHVTDAYTSLSYPVLYSEPENVTTDNYSWASSTKDYPFLIGKTNTTQQQQQPQQQQQAQTQQEKKQATTPPPPQPVLETPPVGFRSAVPLGGIAAGNFEIRGDGTFHDWSVVNQSPGGGAKFGHLADTFVGMRTVDQTTKQTFAAMLTTNTQATTFTYKHKQQQQQQEQEREQEQQDATSPHVQTLIYQGAYPAAKWNIQDTRLPIQATLYAYNTFRVGDLNRSLSPSVVMSLDVSNCGTSDQEVSFMFNLPIQYEQDQTRTHVHKQTRKQTQTGTGTTKYTQTQTQSQAETETETEPGSSSSLNNTDRLSPNVFAWSRVSSHSSCALWCSEVSSPGCMSWVWDSVDGTCLLQSDVPLNRYSSGSYSGVAGSWSGMATSQHVLTPDLQSITSNQPLILSRPGDGPAHGQIALTAAYHRNQATSQPNNDNQTITFSSSANVDVGSLWADFASHGEWSPNSKCESSSSCIGSGAISVSTIIPAGSAGTLSIVFAWYFPNRDHAGEIRGNFYQHLWNNATHVANTVIGSDGSNLLTIANDILSVHSVYTNSSFPTWLQDSLLNTVSHMRSAMYFANGDWRQWEAYDCIDIDSVHNDYQRHLPYLLYFPETTKIKLRAWAKYQIKDNNQNKGMIQETLSTGCLNDVPAYDTAGGRVMGDVTSVWLLLLYQVYRWTGDVSLLSELWPTAMEAINWQLKQANDQGLPTYMINTYDLLALDKYQFNTFNSWLHVSCLAACRELASIQSDTFLYMVCDDAFQIAISVIESTLWYSSNSTTSHETGPSTSNRDKNEDEGEDEEPVFGTPDSSTSGYYRSYYTPNSNVTVPALMSDSLYGLVVASTLGLLPKIPLNLDHIISHLHTENTQNYSPYGLLAQTPPTNNYENSIWTGAAPDWTVLAIKVAYANTWTQQQQHTQDTHKQPLGSLDDLLSVAARGLNAWRLTLNDMWNIHGLIGGTASQASGLPWCTAHYGFHMVFWHIPFALSGQVYSYTGTSPYGFSLSLSPVMDFPFTIPILIPTIMATFQGQIILYNNTNIIQYTLIILTGNLAIDTIIVHNVTQPIKPQIITQGTTMQWTQTHNINIQQNMPMPSVSPRTSDY